MPVLSGRHHRHEKLHPSLSQYLPSGSIYPPEDEAGAVAGSRSAEWFADSPGELYQQIASHPYCQPYGLYEWPYPASHYAEAIEIAGFSLTAVVPSGYANNTSALTRKIADHSKCSN